MYNIVTHWSLTKKHFGSHDNRTSLGTHESKRSFHFKHVRYDVKAKKTNITFSPLRLFL